MSRATPSMEMFVVGAYLQFVEGCDSVTYNSELPDPKEYWVEVVGRNEATQSIFYVDFPKKFDWYPAKMRPDTLVRKLVKRYVELSKEGRALDYEPAHTHYQLWMPRAPARRVAEALPRVRQRLKEEHNIELEVLEPAEVARRIPVVVERVLKLAFDHDNLFIRALLLAQGRLDYERGAPMDEEHIEAMYRFPRTLSSAADVPAFVYQFLTSEEIVHWLDFYSPTFDDLAAWMTEAGPAAGLGELQRALAERGEVADEMDDYYLDEVTYRTRRYSARDLAELTRLVIASADVLHTEVADPATPGPLHIEIDFMLPFLWRAQEWVDPSQIEREILRYGGNRDYMLAHFANEHPDKRAYRAILRIQFFEPRAERPSAYPGSKAMEVPITSPAVSADLEVAVSINYAEDFTGYFVLMMNRLAAGLTL